MDSRLIFKENFGKLIRAKRKIEQKTGTRLNLVNGELFIEGTEINIFAANKIIDAIERDFEISIALLLGDPEYILEDLHIKDFTRKKDMKRVRGRIIGQKGRTIELLGELSDCHVVLNDNTISIIGTAEKMKDAINAARSLIQGAKQANVYTYLELARKRQYPGNLALKKNNKEVTESEESEEAN